MRFFTKKVLQHLEEREKQLTLSRRECLETDSIAEIANRLGAGVFREETTPKFIQLLDEEEKEKAEKVA